MNAQTRNHYYEAELARIRDLAAEFGAAHPALAPVLARPGVDPDVERLLEGVAFLTGLVRQKLNEEFPEFLQQWAHVVMPHFVRPIPCMTVLAFSPRLRLSEPVNLPVGTTVASPSVGNEPCVFGTVASMEIFPLSVTATRIEPVGVADSELVLSLHMDGIALDEWRRDSLRLFLGGEFAEAVAWFAALYGRCWRVRVGSPASGFLELDKAALHWCGFSDEHALIPYPPQSYPGFRLLQEYFALPEKFLFFEVTGLSKWPRTRPADGRFEIRFDLACPNGTLPLPSPRNFVVNAIPAANLFRTEAVPIRLDHRADEYRLAPAGVSRGQRLVYSVNAVVGRSIEQGERAYMSVDTFGREAARKAPLYQITYRPAVDGLERDAFLSVVYSADEKPCQEVLSVAITCCNGTLPESLRVGEAFAPTAGASDRLVCTNLTPVTGYLQSPLGAGVMSRLLSHQMLTHFPLESAENLRSLLSHYLFSDSREWRSDQANRDRIAAIEHMVSRSLVRVIDGAVRQGREIVIRCRSDRFVNQGDLLLFGCVLESFLGRYAAPGSFVSLAIEDTVSGERLEWPPRTN